MLARGGRYPRAGFAGRQSDGRSGLTRKAAGEYSTMRRGSRARRGRYRAVRLRLDVAPGDCTAGQGGAQSRGRLRVVNRQPGAGRQSRRRAGQDWPASAGRLDAGDPDRGRFESRRRAGQGRAGSSLRAASPGDCLAGAFESGRDRGGRYRVSGRLRLERGRGIDAIAALGSPGDSLAGAQARRGIDAIAGWPIRRPGVIARRYRVRARSARAGNQGGAQARSSGRHSMLAGR